MKYSLRSLMIVLSLVCTASALARLAQAGDIGGHPISSGRYHQQSNGLQRYPAAGPSDLNIDGSRFELEQKGYKFSGSIREVSGLIVLDPDVSLNSDKVGQSAMVFCPTRLKDRILLVELDSAVAFCNAVNSGNRLGPTGCGAVVLERRATEKEMESVSELGNPLLSAFLRKNELRGTVTGVAAKTTEDLVPGTGYGKTRGRRGTLSIGRKDGVFAGMQFHHSPTFCVGWVIEVQENRCILLMDDDRARVLEGAVFSSRTQ